jgi:rhodanese-related sulfurtransferase
VLAVGGSVSDLTDLEFCGSPSAHPAQEPVRLLGQCAQNLQEGGAAVFQVRDVPLIRLNPSACLLDVGETAAEVFPEATHIPLSSLRERLGEIEAKKTVYVCDETGKDGYIACRILMQSGVKCSYLSGGMRLYEVMAQEMRAGESVLEAIRQG